MGDFARSAYPFIGFAKNRTNLVKSIKSQDTGIFVFLLCIVRFETIWEILRGALTLSPLPFALPRHSRSIRGGSGDGGRIRGADRRGRGGGSA